MLARLTSRPLGRICAMLMGGATIALAGGCYYEGGPGWSEDQFVYVSRPHQPWTITMKDTRTSTEFWRVEVPVGKQLVIHFLPGQGTKDSYTPDLMEWAIMDDGNTDGHLGNSMPVPPANARRIDPEIRSTPELPPRMIIATTPSGAESKPSSSNP